MCFPIMKWDTAKNKFKKVSGWCVIALQHYFISRLEFKRSFDLAYTTEIECIIWHVYVCTENFFFALVILLIQFFSFTDVNSKILCEIILDSVPSLCSIIFATLITTP